MKAKFLFANILYELLMLILLYFAYVQETKWYVAVIAISAMFVFVYSVLLTEILHQVDLISDNIQINIEAFLKFAQLVITLIGISTKYRQCLIVLYFVIVLINFLIRIVIYRKLPIKIYTISELNLLIEDRQNKELMKEVINKVKQMVFFEILILISCQFFRKAELIVITCGIALILILYQMVQCLLRYNVKRKDIVMSSLIFLISVFILSYFGLHNLLGNFFLVPVILGVHPFTTIPSKSYLKDNK
jgi:membrane protein